MTDDTITSAITVQNPHLLRDVTIKVLRCHSVSVCEDTDCRGDNTSIDLYMSARCRTWFYFCILEYFLNGCL